jgi:hypothetical protein
MRKMLSLALAALAASWLGNSAQAQAPMPVAAPAATPAVAPPVILSGDSACCPENEECGRWHPYAEVGFYILKPHWKNDPAFTAFRTVFTPGVGTSVTTHSTDFSDSTQFVPKISLGAAGPNGIGVRTSWWGFATGGHADFTVPADDNTFAISATPAGAFVESIFGPGSVLAASSRLRMDVWDLEVTKEWEGSSGSLLVSGGLRYAHIAQNYDATVIVPADPAENESLTSGHSFNGIGPTLALEGRLALGRGFFVYALTRGSFLYGTTEQNAHSNNPFFFEEGGQLNGFVSSHAVIPELELELGAGWQRNVGRMQFFVEAGLVGQEWFDVGNSSRSSGNSVFFGEGFGGGSNNDDSLGLFGFSMNFGVRF